MCGHNGLAAHSAAAADVAVDVAATPDWLTATAVDINDIVTDVATNVGINVTDVAIAETDVAVSTSCEI